LYPGPIFVLQRYVLLLGVWLHGGGRMTTAATMIVNKLSPPSPLSPSLALPPPHIMPTACSLPVEVAKQMAPMLMMMLIVTALEAFL
jgi:hypothetical protein